MRAVAIKKGQLREKATMPMPAEMGTLRVMAAVKNSLSITIPRASTEPARSAKLIGSKRFWLRSTSGSANTLLRKRV